jgi:hypothetical protein
MKIRGIRETLDITASIACVVICALLITALVGQYLRSHREVDAQLRTVSAGIQVGTKFPPIPRVRLQTGRQIDLVFCERRMLSLRPESASVSTDIR